MNYHSKKEQTRRIKKLYEKTKTSHVAGVYYDRCKGRYIRFSPSDTADTKYLRRQANKQVRKIIILYQRSQYKKVFEYKWQLD